MAKMRKKQDDMDAKARQQAASRATGMKLRYNVGKTASGDTGFVFGGGLSSDTGAKWWTKNKGTRIDAPTSAAAVQKMQMAVQKNIPASKAAQAAFLASEKKKSGKTTAKNVKRRER